MGEPVGFEGANFLFLGPEGTDVGDLQVFRNEECHVCCWRLTPEELAEVAKTGVVWVQTFSQNCAPMYVSGKALVHVNGKPAKAEPSMPRAPRK